MVKRILVVDDSPTERAHLQTILSKNGYEVIMADGGDEGITKARYEQPDLILMDVVMPHMNGFQATRRITRDEATKHIPVIICTSKGHDTDKVWAIRQGAKGHIVKPISADELFSAIGEVTETAETSEFLKVG